ncbi:hypothetical protein LWI28_022060 [Acer negundo]|uniref:Uncharacterized protein n=1 Tax=Acer negundo TaxID=4023 RepID=A0AAD5JMB5_ACENE|nr:hypothetical protein LWI28_022060 [Acer negundo]
MLNYDGDSEKDDDKDGEDSEDSEGEGRQANERHYRQYFEDGDEEGTQAYEGHNRQFSEDGRQANEGEGRHVDRDDGIINECMALYEGRMVMRKFQERKKECEQWNSVLPPKMNVKILKNSKENMMLTIIATGNKEYEILGPNEGYAVNLGKYSCQCGSWQAYKGMIHPIPDQKRWPEILPCLLIEGQTEHIDPPPKTVQPGRPKIMRKMEPDNSPKGGKSGTVTCKLCNQVGHNKRTCKIKKNKTNETSSSHQPIQQQSTVQMSSSQPPPTQTQTDLDCWMTAPPPPAHLDHNATRKGKLWWRYCTPRLLPPWCGVNWARSALARPRLSLLVLVGTLPRPLHLGSRGLGDSMPMQCIAGAAWSWWRLRRAAHSQAALSR